MPLGFGFGFDPVGFGLALVFLLVDPGIPRLAVGGVFAGEGDGGDVGVGDDAGFLAALDKDLDAGRAGFGVAVEDVAFDLFVAEGDAHIAAVVERLVDRLDAVGFRLK